MILLPFLIFALRVPPIIAVGSYAAFNALTKIGAGFLHWHSLTVDLSMVLALAGGVLPAALLGVSLLGHIRETYGNGVYVLLRTFVGLLLISIFVLYTLQRLLQRHSCLRRHTRGSSGNERPERDLTHQTAWDGGQTTFEIRCSQANVTINL